MGSFFMAYDRKEFLKSERLTYEDYIPHVEHFNLLHNNFDLISDDKIKVNVTLSRYDVRLIYLALLSAQATLKEYDPKKGLNQ
jgi:hypothetical protein